MSGSKDEAIRAFYDQLDQFSDFWVQKRVFSRWRDHFVSTKTRIQKIIQSMDLSEKWLQYYHFRNWKIFVEQQHQKRAVKLRKILLAKRVIKQWRSVVSKNNSQRIFKFFNLLRRHCIESKIEKVISNRSNLRVKHGVFQHMKDYSIYSYQREMRMHEKCVLMYRRHLKMKYFNSLKLSAKIKHDVEYMRSTALESRRFYIFKAFFTPWKQITQKRKINRHCYHYLQEQTQIKKKAHIFYTWINSSIRNYQVRVFEEKTLLSKYFRILQCWCLKQQKKKYQLEYYQSKKINGFKKLILLQWFQYANRKVTSQKRCKAFLMKHQQMIIEMSFKAFKHICDKQIRKEKLIYLSMKHHQLSLLSKCFAVWSLFLDQKQQLFLNKIEASRHCEKMLQRLYFKTMKTLIFKKKFLRDVEAQIEIRKMEREKRSIFTFMKNKLEQNNLIEQKVQERFVIKRISFVFEELKNITQLQKFQKNCVASHQSVQCNKLKERVLKAWALRSLQNRLPRYQKYDANQMRQLKLYSKSFLTLKKRMICKRNGKVISENKQAALQRNSFYLWNYLKVQEERINRNIIGNIINRSYKMFYYLKDYANTQKKNREIISYVQTKKNYRVQKLGWSVWKFFLRMREEKSMYKMSLLRYALMKRAKQMISAWSTRVNKRKREEDLALKVQDCQKIQRKVMLLRLLKEGASPELHFLKFIKNFRSRMNRKIYRKLFDSWVQYTMKKSIVKRMIKSKRELAESRIEQSILVEWQCAVQRKKRDRLRLEEHICFKQCVLIANVLKYWKRLTRVLSKENSKIHQIQNNHRARLEYNTFYTWCDAYSERHFSQQTEKMQQFLEKKVAFNKVIRVLRKRVEESEAKRNQDVLAIHHYMITQMSRMFIAWQQYHQQQYNKKRLEIMSSMLAKGLAFKRVIKRMKIMKNYGNHRKDCFQFYILKLYAKTFNVLKHYKLFRENQRILAIKYSQSLSLQKVQKCFSFLKKNVDSQAEQRIFRKKFEKKRTLKLKRSSMLLWKDYYLRKSLERKKINGLVEDRKAVLLRQCFLAMHHSRLQKIYLRRCQETAEKFDIQRIKRSIFDSWRLTCNEEKLVIRQSNMAFSHYCTTLSIKVIREWIRFIQEEQKESNNTYNCVALRSARLKQSAFNTLKWHYTLSTKQKIANSNHAYYTKSQFLRKWKKITIKNKLSVPAANTIASIVNTAIKRLCFFKILNRSQTGKILKRLSRIYSHNLNYNILKVFLVNMLLQRRAENFDLHKRFQLMKNTFDALRQYAAIKHNRTFKIVQTLQNIHGMVQYNIAQKVFYALKQYHYIKIQKRNSLIRYVNQLKLKTLLSLRKSVLDSYEQGRNESRITAAHV